MKIRIQLDKSNTLFERGDLLVSRGFDKLVIFDSYTNNSCTEFKGTTIIRDGIACIYESIHWVSSQFRKINTGQELTLKFE